MFRFSIRELMLLTLVVALAVGWAADRTRLAREIAILEIKMEPNIAMNGGSVTVTGYPERKKDWLERLVLILRAPALNPP